MTVLEQAFRVRNNDWLYWSKRVDEISDRSMGKIDKGRLLSERGHPSNGAVLLGETN
jgi:hypothetical protein